MPYVKCPKCGGLNLLMRKSPRVGTNWTLMQRQFFNRKCSKCGCNFKYSMLLMDSGYGRPVVTNGKD